MTLNSEIVVIDNGTETCRAGFSGDDSPRATVLSVVGRPRHTGISLSRFRVSLVGDGARDKSHELTLRHPMEFGIVTNWDDMEKVWHHTFTEHLHVTPEEHAVLLTETPRHHHFDNREKTLEYMFERFQTPAFYLAHQAALSLYASGRNTGIVVDSGYEVTHSIPVLDGIVQFDATSRLDIGGRDLGYLLMKQLEGANRDYDTQALKDKIHEIKARRCYLALDYWQELKASTTQTYTLPDGHQINLKNERFSVPEALFQTSMILSTITPIDVMVTNSISRSDEGVRQALYNNVLLAGGNTMFSGLGERLQKELTFRAPSGTQVNVIAPHNRDKTSWIGGSMFASRSNFEKECISSQEYAEFGPAILRRKCL